MREGQVAQTEMLHAQEQLRQVGALEQGRSGAVGGDGLVVLTLGGEGVGEPDPGGAEVRVHHAGLAEEAPRFGHVRDGQVIDPHGEPGGGFVRVGVGQFVGEEEEGVGSIELIEGGEMEGEHGEVVRVGGEDGGGDGEGLGEAALGEEELGFGVQDVGVLGQVVVGGEAFDGVGKDGRVLVLRQTGGIEHLGELGGFLSGVGMISRGRSLDGVKVQFLDEGPLFIRRHQLVLHQLLKGLKALDIDGHGSLVALFGPVEGVLLGKTKASQMTHGCLTLDVGHALPFAFLTPLDPIGASGGGGGLRGQSRAPILMLQFPSSFARGDDEMDGVPISQ